MHAEDEDRAQATRTAARRRRRNRLLWGGAAVVAALVVGAAVWRAGLLDRQAAPPVAQAPDTTAPVAPAPAAAPPVQHVIEAPATQPPLAAAQIGSALSDLLGRKAVLSFLQTDSFPRRVVATVDNLARQHAPPLVWPVNPTAGRFNVQRRGDGAVIAEDNSLRYAPLVQLVESVEVGRAVDLYVRLYPLLQQEYEQQGYPNRYFNDRVLVVIDHLLATPQPGYPLKVQLTEVKGPVASDRPWVRYEYADPALESLSAGQKMLLRTGEVNSRRLKARLAQLREEILRRSTPQPAR